MTKGLNSPKNNSPHLSIIQENIIPLHQKHFIRKKNIQMEENSHYFCNKLVITPDGKKILTYAPNLVLWDLENGETTKLGDNNYSCYLADITPNGRWALTSDRKILTLWDLNEKKPLKTIASPGCYKIIIQPDGEMAVVIFYSNVKFYDLSTYKVIREISGFDGLFNFSITPNFKTGVWVSDANLIVFDIETEKIMKIIRGRGLMNIEDTTINFDADKVLDFRYHKMNYLWDIGKGELVGKIGDNITDITPDFKLAITGDDTYGKLLDITQLNKTGIFTYESKKIKVLDRVAEFFLKDSKITPDGKKGISLDENCNILIWNIKPRTTTPKEYLSELE